MKTIESNLQINCVNVFRMQYPHLRKRLFAIPNGGKRSVITAAIMKKEGVLAGALDIFLAVPRYPYAGLFIEMKTDKGKLTDNQVAFIKEVEADYKCVVCRSVEQFLQEVKDYLHQIQN